jgi:hypothetical protein
MAPPCVIIASVTLSAIASIMFLVGCVGNESSPSIVEDIPWGVISYENFGAQGYLYLGTSAYFVDDYFGKGDGLYENCDADYCDTCKDSGATSIGLTIVAFILGVATAVLGFLQISGRPGTDGVALKTGILLCAIGAASLSLAAFIIFSDCIQDARDDYNDKLTIDVTSSGPGIGSLISGITGFILMVIAVLMNLLSFCCCPLKTTHQNTTNSDNLGVAITALQG